AGVERVLDQLLDDRRRPLDNLASGDFLRDLGIQDTNGHGSSRVEPGTSSPSRRSSNPISMIAGSESIVVCLKGVPVFVRSVSRLLESVSNPKRLAERIGFVLERVGNEGTEGAAELEAVAAAATGDEDPLAAGRPVDQEVSVRGHVV